MVKSVTSLTGNGLRDWLIQRVTAVILALYTLFLVGFLMLHQPMTYDLWADLYDNVLMRVFTFFALLSMVYHTWVGVWTVLTDYIKCACLRLILLVLAMLALLGYMVWGVMIVWGIY